MKRFLLCSILALISTIPAAAVEWHTVNQVKVNWVHELGDKIPADQITFNLHVANALTDPQATNPVQVVSSITEGPYTLTLNADGDYYIGVSAVRTVNGKIVAVSGIRWGKEGTSTTAGWGVSYWEKPEMPSSIFIDK